MFMWKKNLSQKDNSDHDPLLDETVRDAVDGYHKKQSTSWYPLIIACQSIIIGVAFVYIAILWFRPNTAVYSPVQKLRYHDVMYASGFRDETTEYQGTPSPEVDQAWENLYRYTYSRISKDEAKKLRNDTVSIPGDPDGYLISVDVFHQLHCLNMIRKKVWNVEPKTKIEKGTMQLDHLDHCIDSIRQSLMCAADVTPLPWAWRDGKVHPVATVVHTCRDFEAVVQWAGDHEAPDISDYLLQ